MEYEWHHAAIQLELDKIIESYHNDLYNLTLIPHQQAKAAILTIDASLFMIIARQESLEMSKSIWQGNSSASLNAALHKNSALMCRRAPDNRAWSR